MRTSSDAVIISHMITTANDRREWCRALWWQSCAVLALAMLVGLVLAAVPVVGQQPEAPVVATSAADPIRVMEAEAEATGKTRSNRAAGARSRARFEPFPFRTRSLRVSAIADLA